jgi:starch synthase (maltosyl-transferring)
MTSARERSEDGRIRAVIERITPCVDDGRYAVKRIVGDRVDVEADCFNDGHERLAACVRYCREGDSGWHEAPMAAIGNDRWRGTFVVDSIGRYRYTVTAWIDYFLSWQHDFDRRIEADDVRLAARSGALIIRDAAARATGDDRVALERWAARLDAEREVAVLHAIADDEALVVAMARHADRRYAATYPMEFAIVVDRPLARCGAWYELFPRSTAAQPGAHGTFADCAARLPYAARMGFDIVYLPPIHPIGRTFRKGRNNTLTATATDVGSPWAIGATEGGHTAIHPQLGTLDDFHKLVASAKALGLEIALDIAFQCAPDHPYVKAHPQWFRARPDGTIQYAENPPKKYQDIYPFDFESADWAALWDELAGVFDHWIAQGVTIFRVDNPHTKPFAFWEWAIERLKRDHPELIFLSEAFTRPKVMHRLAKLGFTQSYTYFAWRNTKRELIDYFTELAHGPGAEYLRPNCWPNTPDILTEHLQLGGRAAFMARAVLAATLSANYGVYGPAFELLEHEPREPGSEEYRDSEKYELRRWDLDRPDSLADFIGRLNAARRDNPALQRDDGLVFFATDNDALLCYAKLAAEGDNAVLVVVNLDPHHTQAGWVTLDVERLGIADRAFQVHDLLSGARYLWSGARNFVELDPARSPAHVLRLRRRVRTEHDFDYFL